MPTYDAKITITLSTTIRVDGSDEDDAYDRLYGMLAAGDYEIDLEEAFDDFEVNEMEDISEDLWATAEYSYLKEIGVF